MLAVKLFEKGSMSGYPIIIVKVFENIVESLSADWKLEISNIGKG